MQKSKPTAAVRRFSLPNLTWLSLAALAACGSPESLAGLELEGDDTNLAASALSSSGAQKFTPQRNSTLCVQTENGRTDNGARVVLAACGNSATQVWTAAQGRLVTANNKCLDVVDGKRDNGVRLQIWDCAEGNDNQRFSVSDNRIAWTNRNKCLDLTDGAAQAGTPLQLWDCVGGSTNQAWNNGPGPSDTGNGSVGNGASTAGYMRTRGTDFVDASGNKVVLRGTNIGGWLVTEAWMNGYTDDADNASTSSGNSLGRFALEGLEARFGGDKAKTLMNAWYDNFITSADLDKIKALGMNTLRVPFGYRNLQNADGSWIKTAAGRIDFGRLDWIIDQAQARGLYVILDYHIWHTQRQDYDNISRDSDASRAAQAQAAKIWTQVARRYKGNTTIIAYDVLNEPTGSPGNAMQIAMYNAVRAEDADRIIIMESMGQNPRELGWTQVAYSIHQYKMMGTDFGTNQAEFNKDLRGDIQNFRSFNIPTYIGEFMVQDSGPTLNWLLTQYRDQGLHFSSWTYKTVNMGSWGFYNLPDASRVNLSRDSYETILQKWSNMPEPQAQTNLVNTFKSVFSGR